MKESKNPFVSMYKGFKNIFKGKKKAKTPAVQEEALMDMTNISPIVNNPQTNNATQPITPQQDALAGIKQREHKKEDKNLFPFRYKAKTATGRKATGIFSAESINDCIHFLEIQGYTDIQVKPKEKWDFDIVLDKKLGVGELAFDLTQLSTYIKAGIPLVDAVKILAQQASKPNQRLAYQRLLYDLLKGDNLSDDMAEYYESMEQVRKEMKSAMTYPAFVIVLAIGVLVFMLIYLVPQFVTLYEGQGASLPAITLFIINSSNFLKNNYIMIIVVILVTILVVWYLYTRIKSFRSVVQTILMKLPAFGNMIIYKEVYNFTKTFASLINHGVFITDSMEILSKITTNEIYKHIISKTMTNLAKGNTISESFKGEWAFPEIAYQMLVTGESTGQLGLMMEKVSEHYQALHKSAVAQLKSMIEPIMIIVLAGIVGVLLLSIITPMFDIYNQIG